MGSGSPELVRDIVCTIYVAQRLTHCRRRHRDSPIVRRIVAVVTTDRMDVSVEYGANDLCMRIDRPPSNKALNATRLAQRQSRSQPTAIWALGEIQAGLGRAK